MYIGVSVGGWPVASGEVANTVEPSSMLLPDGSSGVLVVVEI